MFAMLLGFCKLSQKFLFEVKNIPDGLACCNQRCTPELRTESHCYPIPNSFLSFDGSFGSICQNKNRLKQAKTITDDA